MQPSMETFRAWFAALAEEDRRRAARFALLACRRALPVREEIYVTDPRPRAALDLVEAWLDDKVDAGAVSEAAPGLIDPSPSSWRSPSVFAGDAVRQLVGAVPALEVAALTAAVEDAITSLDQNWRWRWGCPSQIGEELRRVFLGLPLAAAGLPRFRVEKEESTGGDLFEIEYRREFWVVDG